MFASVRSGSRYWRCYSPTSVKSLRIFCYVQHLSGVGHMMRMQQIAVALSEQHHVSILDGGRELPFPPAVHRVAVPRITRRDGELVPLDRNLPLAQLMALRQQCLQTMLRESVPDVILVEHFPFSKWELESEIESLLFVAKQRNPALTVIASLRDISPPTRFEALEHYEHRVLSLLSRHFDGLLVHADPTLCTLQQYFPACRRITIPVFHTGIVADTSLPHKPARLPALDLPGEHAVASIGGGADQARVLSRVTQAWRHLSRENAVGSRSLLLFGGTNESDGTLQRLSSIEDSVFYMGFSPDFRYWLQGASLSVSCAGYNTCANLLVARTPALLIPNKTMSDQQERAHLLESRGVAQCVPPHDSGEDPLLGMIAQCLGGPRSDHDINTDGARQSVHCIEALASGLHTQ